MATISLLTRVLNGAQRQVDVSQNALAVGSLIIGGTGGTSVTQTIMNNLIALLTSLPSTTPGSAGSTTIGDNNSYTNFTPTAATVKGALSGIDSALTAVAGGAANKSLSNLTATAINQSLLPGSDNTLTLGSSSFSWTSANIHTLLDATGVVSADIYNRVLKDSSAAAQITWSTSGVTLGGALNMGTHQINNVAMAATPASTDGTNVAYVQGLLQGLSPKSSVKAATIAALPANTYSNGTSGVGATLTATANGVLTVDSYTVQLNDRILVKNEATASHNGIYYVSTLGTSSVPYVLTRALDADTCQPASNPGVTSGIWTFVEATSTTLANTGWILSTPDPITLGTTSLSFTQFYAAGEYTFGNGLTTSGNAVSVNLSGTGGLSFSGSAIVVNTLSTGGIQISSNSLALLLVANTGLVTSASGLAWQFDNSTIGINGSNQAYVKNAGISATQIATGVADQATIVGGNGTVLSVAYAPAMKFSGTAGQAFSANTTYAVRFGLPANSETAGRLYACDISTTSFDLFWCVGFIQSTSAISAGGAVTVIQSGPITLGSSDTAFGANDPGKPCFLQSGGTNATTTAPSTTGQAVAKLGIVTSTSSFLAQIAGPFVY